MESTERNPQVQAGKCHKCSSQVTHDEDKSDAKDSCDHFAEAVSGAYWPQKGVMAAKEDDIKEAIPETIKRNLFLWIVKHTFDYHG